MPVAEDDIKVVLSPVQNVNGLVAETVGIEGNGLTVTPVATTPTSAGIFQVLSIPANGVSVIGSIPPNAWFIASAATSLEITPGEGIS